MTLTELRYIAAVAREGHFGRAAKACFVSQPTLSLGIKKLEEELGVVIFERSHSHKDIVITPIGKKIIQQANQVLTEIKGIKELASSANGSLKEPLRIGAIYTIGPYLFPALLPMVRENAPQLPLFVEENFTVNLADKLKKGDIDLALLSAPFEEPGIETLKIYQEPFVLVIPSSHPLVMKEDIDLSDLRNETVLLLGPQHCFRDQVVDICPECAKNLSDDYDLQKTLTGSSLETVRYMVASGVGLTILPCTAAGVDRYKQGLVKICRVEALNKGREVILAWRKDFPRMDSINVIAKSIRQCSLTGVQMYDEPDKDSPASTNLVEETLKIVQ